MSLTFSFRRKSLLSDPQRVDKLLATFPALQLVSEVCIEIFYIVYFARGGSTRETDAQIFYDVISGFQI